MSLSRRGFIIGAGATIAAGPAVATGLAALEGANVRELAGFYRGIPVYVVDELKHEPVRIFGGHITYGRSPAMYALGDIRAWNALPPERRRLAARELCG